MLVSPAELVSAAKAEITETSAEDFHKSADSGVLLIDIRDQNDFDGGHIPGAVCSPRGMFEFNIHELVKTTMPNPDLPPEDQALALYCGTGGRSALAAKCAASLGYTRVCSIAGGINGWNEAGLPLESTKE